MKIGILGGGQLAQMMLQTNSAKKHEFLIYTNSPAAPTQGLAKQFIADYTDEMHLKEFANHVDIVTFETETIPALTVNYLKQFVAVYPSEKSLITLQDRLLEKQLFDKVNITTNKYLAINHNADLDSAITKLGFPFIIKARKNGYDGKLQWLIKNQNDLVTLKNKTEISNCLAEEFVPFTREVSIVGVRDKAGNILCYDLCENYHRDGILRYSLNRTNDPLQNSATHALKKIMTEIQHVGVMAIEFFDKQGTLLANEVAPRVHNSGHWTIEGAKTSQFENHLRAITGEMLGDTDSYAKALMINFIGDYAHKEKLIDLNFVFHDYHKAPKTNRKLAHATLVTEHPCDIEQALKFMSLPYE